MAIQPRYQGISSLQMQAMAPSLEIDAQPHAQNPSPAIRHSVAPARQSGVCHVPTATSCPQLTITCGVGDWRTFSPQKHTCDTSPCSGEGAPCWEGLQEPGQCHVRAEVPLVKAEQRGPAQRVAGSLRLHTWHRGQCRRFLPPGSAWGGCCSGWGTSHSRDWLLALTDGWWFLPL